MTWRSIGDLAALELRVLAHYRRHYPYAKFLEFGTVTGRMTTHVPPFKEVPKMTAIDRNPENLQDPNVRRLSEFLFAMYHSKQREPEQGRHSRVSDALAKRLADEPARIMELATLMAYCHGMPKSQEVTAFAGEPKEGSSISDLLADLLGINRDDDDTPIQDLDLIDEDGDLNTRVLWARAWQKLGGDEAEVLFDPYYTDCARPDCYKNPAIHGHGVDPFTVNGAMLAVLDDANAMHLVGDAFVIMADTQDEDGWVYCA